ncbi:hypothetical protein FEM03_08925 [Phragmitibacter flavus]|uniref:Antitoxin n=1 Tax=Phragmitibacter flavus TaxID=2576071 RepID=A0A5R8KFI1_9BACT|nr:hypothetical protein [Phragmitibacter flavus]TLD71027.1 hypothetical protein FEM03_08925 [Phragmitibacter flavus]
MRTTIEIPDALFKQAKSRAAASSVTLKELVIDALQSKLSVAPSAEKVRVRIPMVPSANPGSNKLTAARIKELEMLMEAGDVSA